MVIAVKYTLHLDRLRRADLLGLETLGCTGDVVLGALRDGPQPCVRTTPEIPTHPSPIVIYPLNNLFPGSSRFPWTL